jgi:hypothetical protein
MSRAAGTEEGVESTGRLDADGVDVVDVVVNNNYNFNLHQLYARVTC